MAAPQPETAAAGTGPAQPDPATEGPPVPADATRGGGIGLPPGDPGEPGRPGVGGPLSALVPEPFRAGTVEPAPAGTRARPVEPGRVEPEAVGPEAVGREPVGPGPVGQNPASQMRQGRERRPRNRQTARSGPARRRYPPPAQQVTVVRGPWPSVRVRIWSRPRGIPAARRRPGERARLPAGWWSGARAPTAGARSGRHRSPAPDPRQDAKDPKAAGSPCPASRADARVPGPKPDAVAEPVPAPVVVGLAAAVEAAGREVPRGAAVRATGAARGRWPDSPNRRRQSDRRGDPRRRLGRHS